MGLTMSPVAEGRVALGDASLLTPSELNQCVGFFFLRPTYGLYMGFRVYGL